MDFTNILSSISSYIPASIAGIDTVYIAAGGTLVLLLLWIMLRGKKKTANKELLDFAPEEVEDTQLDAAEGVDSEEALTEEDGFMPSNTPQEIQVTEEPVPVDDVLAPEPATETKEEESKATEEVTPAPARKTDGVVRKKRESTRNGRKISKADFSDFSGRRVLIAEDNLINQKVLNGVLNESGIEVVMADDGQFVLDILEQDNDFEIILMDAHMPRVDGFEATRAIRANPAYDHITVVALSGDTAVDDIRHMTEAGMEEHLEKPLKMDALYDVMSMYYTLGEAEEETDEVHEEIEELEISVDVKDLACLDYDLGLEICGDDEAMYKELLKEFFIGYKDSSKKMREALVAKDFHAAQNILIDVKGTASNLGAKQFIYITEQFLEALSAGNTAAYSSLFKDYQTYLLALLKSIQQAFKV